MNLLELISDKLFPENFTCHLCGREVFCGEDLCSGCRESVNFNDGATCVKCGRKTLVEELCLECKAKVPVYERAVSPLVYSDGGQRLIHAFKNGKPWLSGYFARLAAGKCKDFSDAQAIVYVPMTKSSVRRRGYNQSYLFAKRLSAILNLPVIKDAVIKKKNTKAQKSLTKREREENLKGSFFVKASLVNGKNLILADDVMTTGATAETVTAELLKKGAGKVYFVSVASVQYKTLL